MEKNRNLSESNSILNDWVNQLRNKEIQNDRLRFRRNLERIGEIGAYEISKTFNYKNITLSTPLGEKQSSTIDIQPVVLTILRAGVPLFQGVLNYLDAADSGFIGAYRKHGSNKDFNIQQDYITCPNFDNRPLIITDPMLATGASLIEALNALLKINTPSEIHILCVIASTIGLERVSKEFPDATIWFATKDEKLDDKGYIVPGLGDAGDLSYGQKLQS